MNPIPEFDTACKPPQRWVTPSYEAAKDIVDAINSYVCSYRQLGPVANLEGKNPFVEIQMLGGSLVITDFSTGGTFRGYFNDTTG